MARLLNGTTQWLEVVKTFASGATPLSMCCWFNMTTTTLSSVIMALHDGTANERFQLNHPVSPCSIQALTAHAGSTSNSATSTSASAGVWNHAAGVWASAISRASYLNGAGKGTNTTSRVPTGITTFTLGARNGGAAPFDGMFAEVCIYNIALSDADVAVLAAGVSPLMVHPEALVAYWPLLYSTEINLMSQDSLTITGAATQAAHPRIYWPSTGRKHGPARSASVARTLTLSLDAALQKARTATASLDSALQKARTATASLDAGVAIKRTVTANLDSALQKARTATASLDSALQKGRTATASMDAGVAIRRTATVLLDAALQRAMTVAASLDSALRQARTASVSLDAALVNVGLVTSSMDGAISRANALTAALDAVLFLAAARSTYDRVDILDHVNRGLEIGPTSRSEVPGEVLRSASTGPTGRTDKPARRSRTVKS